MNKKKLLTIFTLFFIINISSKGFEVSAVFETPPVQTKGDAADDPAFWLNKGDPSNSIIFGTDKRSGIYAYDLKGDLITFTEAGEINNIDLRTIDLDHKADGTISKQPYTFLIATNRSLNTIDLWVFFDGGLALSMFTRSVKLKNKNLRPGQRIRINDKTNAEFSIPENPDFRILSESNIYGVCAGIHPKYGFVAFVTEDRGPNVEIYYLGANGLELFGSFSNGGESEGCVFDDENLTLIISEENVRGNLKAYKFDENFDLIEEPIIIDSRNGNISGDPEGVSIYKTNTKEGYIVLSSQGDSKFNLYNREFPYEFINSFKIVDNKNIDGVSDTDGIETINFNIDCDDFSYYCVGLTDSVSETFPKGIMIAQDGYNYDGDDKKNQNFKLISFKEILDNLDVTR